MIKKTLIGLALIAALASAEPAVAQDKVELSGSAGVKVASAHIVDSGTEIGEGPVQQDYISATASYKGFGLTGLIWHDFSLKTKSNDETDYWLTLDIPTPLKEHGVDLAARYKRFIFPSHPEWGQDNVAGGIISYSGFVNAKLEWNHLFPQGDTEEGDRLFLTLSKPVIVYETDDLTVKLNPTISSSYDDNFYGRDGLMHLTPGIAIKLVKGPYSIGADVKGQIGIGETGSGEDIEDRIYGGISAGLNF